jgi:hypothetical protein
MVLAWGAAAGTAGPGPPGPGAGPRTAPPRPPAIGAIPGGVPAGTRPATVGAWGGGDHRSRRWPEGPGALGPIDRRSGPGGVRQEAPRRRHHRRGGQPAEGPGRQIGQPRVRGPARQARLLLEAGVAELGPQARPAAPRQGAVDEVAGRGLGVLGRRLDRQRLLAGHVLRQLVGVPALHRLGARLGPARARSTGAGLGLGRAGVVVDLLEIVVEDLDARGRLGGLGDVVVLELDALELGIELDRARLVADPQGLGRRRGVGRRPAAIDRAGVAARRAAAGGAFAAVGRVVLGHAVAVVPQPGPGRRLGDPRLLEERGDRRVATGQLARALEALDGGVGIALAQERGAAELVTAGVARLELDRDPHLRQHLVVAAQGQERRRQDQPTIDLARAAPGAPGGTP